ncbi:signal peptide protein, partial [mine drainage metagenome]
MRVLRSFGWPAFAAMLLVLSGLAGQRALAQTATPADMSPVGIWKQIDDKTGEAKSLIQISEVNGELTGKVLKVLKSRKGPNPLCDKCSGALKNQPVTGMEILRGMKPDGSSWSGGTILDPKSGRTYRCD